MVRDMTEPVRVLLERGKKKRVVASAFDWPGWDRSTKLDGDVLAVLNAYRPRFARVAELAGYGAEFGRLGDLEVVVDRLVVRPDLGNRLADSCVANTVPAPR